MNAKRSDLRVTLGATAGASGGASKVPYSPGTVVESLQSAGVETDDAIRIARGAEKHFRNEGRDRVSLARLVAWISERTEETAGAEIRQRFEAQVPPFAPLRVVRSGEKPVDEAFSRRTLATSLEGLELQFKEAYAIATLVEQRLRAEGRGRVAESDLAQRVALMLEARYGRDVRLRYEERVAQPTDLFVVEPDGSELPYSRGVLARSLMAIGLGPELSHNLAKRAENALWERDDRRLTRREVRGEVVRLLEEEAGHEFAQRYLLMRSVRRPEEPLVILIGGAAGVGKSALASEIGYRLGIPRIVPTDAVRQALRSLIGPELAPVLHSSSYDAWLAELLPPERERAKVKRKRVVRGFQAQVQQLATAVNAIVERNVAEATSMVMEGIHLVPGIGAVGEAEGATVVQLVLVVEDEGQHLHHFDMRERRTGQRRAKAGYAEHFKEIRILQRYIAQRCKAEGVPLIEASDFDSAVERSVEAILEVVLASRGYRDDVDAALDALLAG